MTLLSDLGTLESAGLIRVDKVEPDLEYHFMHSLVQDAAYASLLESDRKRLHLAVGQAIEELYPGRNREMAALLGYHFREAGEDERALRYYMIAGDEALTVYANQEAELQYRRGLELLCCNDKDIASLYSGLAEALFRQSRFDGSTQAVRASIQIYLDSGDQDNAARMYARLGRILWYEGDRPAGLRACLEGMELVKEAEEGFGKATLMHETARAYHFNGKSDMGLPLCKRALEIAEKLNALYLQADTLATMGILDGLTPQESLQALQRSVDLAEEHKFYQVGVRAHQNLGSAVRNLLLDNDSALEHFRRSADLGRLRGAPSEEILGSVSYASCLFAIGRGNEMDAELSRLDELMKKIPNPSDMKIVVAFLRAVLQIYRGDWDTPVETFRMCLKYWEVQQNFESLLNMYDELTYLLCERGRWGYQNDLAEVEELMAQVYKLWEMERGSEGMWIPARYSILRARQGRLDEARNWLVQAREQIANKPSALETLFVDECEMEIALAEKDWNKALEWVEKVATQQLKAGFRAHYARMLVNWGDFHIQRGEPADIERAQVLLREALTMCAETGMGRYPELIQQRLQVARAASFAQALDHEKMTRDLKKARLVQESLLPENPPQLKGWEVAVSLQPAFETSGDYYDFMTFPDGRLGLLIADVTDKGTSAALYMAVSRSLWRTFASEYPDNPEVTMEFTNRRILADTHGGLYLTLFYAILNPQDGSLVYCSAGHYPVYWLCQQTGEVQELERTGIPVGVMEDTHWESASICMQPGDRLVLYTDGITDAMNSQEEFFGQERLLEAVKGMQGKPVGEIRAAVLGKVKAWVGKARQFDDITLMVVGRENSEGG